MVLAPEHPLVAKLTTPARRAEVEAYVASATRQTDIEREAAGPGQERRVHRRLRGQSGQRREHSDLDRRLRADDLRHRRHHGGAGARRA